MLGLKTENEAVLGDFWLEHLGRPFRSRACDDTIYLHAFEFFRSVHRQTGLRLPHIPVHEGISIVESGLWVEATGRFLAYRL